MRGGTGNAVCYYDTAFENENSNHLFVKTPKGSSEWEFNKQFYEALPNGDYDDYLIWCKESKRASVIDPSVEPLPIFEMIEGEKLILEKIIYYIYQ